MANGSVEENIQFSLETIYLDEDIDMHHEHRWNYDSSLLRMNFLSRGSSYRLCDGLSCIILNEFYFLLKRPYKNLIPDNITVI